MATAPSDRASTIFTKRSGSTDRGKDYEHLFMAHLILKLLSDEKIEDFYLSSNDKNFGSFDDVVLEIKYFNKKERDTYACQLKQKQRKKTLTTSALAAAKGGFSIKEYFDDYNSNQALQENSVKVILFTTCKLEIDDKKNKGIQLCLSDEPITVNFQNTIPNIFLNTSSKSSSYVFTNAENKHADFFNNFALYAGQADVDTIERDLLVTFKIMFNCDESVFREYISFIINWSIIEGKKEKLNKNWMKDVVSTRVLSPFIQPLTFSESSSVSDNAKLYRYAVSKFQITLLDTENYDQLKAIWKDAVDDINDFEKVERARVKYQILLDPIKKKKDLNGENKELSKLLWLLEKCPLVIHDCPKAYESLKLCNDRMKIILISKQAKITKGEELQDQSHLIFRTLADVAEEKEIYSQMLEKFKYSLGGQDEAPLKCLVEENQELNNVFTTNELIHMINGPLFVATQNEILPPCHISRTLMRAIIDFGFLKECYKDNLILVNCIEDPVVLNLGDSQLVSMENIDEKVVRLVNEEEKQIPNTLLFFSRNDCSQEEFDKLCDKNPTVPCHQLKFLNKECLEWIRSRGSVEDLQKFRLEFINDYTLEESKLKSSAKHGISIICANPGMGKSTLMKSLKTGISSSVCTLFIYVRNHALFFHKNGADIDKFIQHLTQFIKGDKNPLVQKILEMLTRNNRIELIWDGLDEVSEIRLQIILTMIEELAKRGIRQWITSRNHLRDMLEKRFGVLSFNLDELNDAQQQKYIKERLQLSAEEECEVFQKIKRNIQKYSYHNILGIPLQIYMLTELCHRDKQKYLSLMNEEFTIADLYGHFIDEKFNIYYEEKEKRDPNVEADLQKCETEKRYNMGCYKETAFQSYFGNSYFKSFRSFFSRDRSTEFLAKIKSSQDSIGLILRIAEDNSPQFVHSSYGEYFTALYLSENNKDYAKDKNFISDERYTNIRFFLDLILAGNSKAHIAILHKNCYLLNQCTDKDLTVKDRIGRNVLEVTCAWSKSYPLLESERSKETFLIDDSNFRKIKNVGNVNYKQFSKSFAEISKATLSVRKSVLLLPFTSTYISKKTNFFLQKHVPTLLFYAVIFDYSSVFDCFSAIPLVSLTSDLNKGKTLLDLAIELKHINCLKKMVLFDPYLNYLESTFESLQQSCPEIQIVFKDFLNNAVLNSNNTTLIHRVCRQNKKNLLKFLTENGSSVNVADKNLKTPLHYACQFADLDAVKTLYKHGALINSTDREGKTALHYACKSFHVAIVSFLVENGSKLDAADTGGKYPLHYSINFEVAQILLEHGALLNAADNEGKMPIHCAFIDKSSIRPFSVTKTEPCKCQLGYNENEYKTRQNAKETDDDEEKLSFWENIAVQTIGRLIMFLVGDVISPVMTSTIRGMQTSFFTTVISSTVKFKLKARENVIHLTNLFQQKGVDVNATDFYGRTPIHYACVNREDCFAKVMFLQNRGARMNVPDKYGKIPLHYVCELSWYAVIDFFQKEVCSERPIDTCNLCSTALLKLLIKNAGKIDFHKDDLVSDACPCFRAAFKFIVMHSVFNYNSGEFQYLIDLTVMPVFCTPYQLLNLFLNDEDCNVTDENGKSAIHYACQYSTSDFINKLIEHGCKLDITDNDGKMPLHYACMNEFDNVEIIKLLIENGAKINTTDKSGKLPKDYVPSSIHNYNDVMNLVKQSVLSRMFRLYPAHDNK